MTTLLQPSAYSSRLISLLATSKTQNGMYIDIHDYVATPFDSPLLDTLLQILIILLMVTQKVHCWVLRTS